MKHVLINCVTGEQSLIDAVDIPQEPSIPAPPTVEDMSALIGELLLEVSMLKVTVQSLSPTKV